MNPQQLIDEYNRVQWARQDALMNGQPSYPEWDAILAHGSAQAYANSKSVPTVTAVTTPPATPTVSAPATPAPSAPPAAPAPVPVPTPVPASQYSPPHTDNPAPTNPGIGLPNLSGPTYNGPPASLDDDDDVVSTDTPVYDINGNVTSYVYAGQSFPQGGFHSAQDAASAKAGAVSYQNSVNPGSGDRWGNVNTPLVGPASGPSAGSISGGPILSGNPNAIGGSLDTPHSPTTTQPGSSSTTSLGSIFGQPDTIPTGGASGGSSGGGIFGSGLDIGFPGLTLPTVTQVAGGIGLGAVLGGSGGSSGGSAGGGTVGLGTSGGGTVGQPENPSVTIPPVIGLGSGSNSGMTTTNIPTAPTVPIGTPTTPILVTGGSAPSTPTVGLGSGYPTTPTTPSGPGANDRPPVVIPPIVPPIGGGGGTTPTVTPTTPVIPTTPTTPTTTQPNFTMPNTPLNRNLLGEGTATNNALGQINPGVLNNYSQFSGQYGNADMANFINLLNSLGGANGQLTNFANAQTGASNTALRTGNVNDAAALGGQALSTLQGLNPNQYAALNAAQQSATNGGGQTPNTYQTALGNSFTSGPQYQQVNAQYNPLLGAANTQAASAGYSPLGTDLQQMARDQLNLGSSLSGQQTRDATQAAREGWAARGLINSPGAVAQEVLNRDQYGQQLLQQRQQFAQNVNQLGQSQQGLNNNYMLGALGANATQGQQGLQAGLANQQAGMNALQNNQGLGLNLAQLQQNQGQQGFNNVLQNAYLQSANAFNPFASITNANTANQGTNTNLFNQGAGFSSGALGNQYAQGMVNPFNPYAQDVYGSNFNADNARYISAGNNAAAASGAQDAASGQIANSFLGLLGQYFRPTAQGGFGGTGTPGT